MSLSWFFKRSLLKVEFAAASSRAFSSRFFLIMLHSSTCSLNICESICASAINWSTDSQSLTSSLSILSKTGKCSLAMASYLSASSSFSRRIAALSTRSVCVSPSSLRILCLILLISRSASSHFFLVLSTWTSRAVCRWALLICNSCSSREHMSKTLAISFRNSSQGKILLEEILHVWPNFICLRLLSIDCTSWRTIANLP
mmetsp:Transcript_1582/g.4724  ORF Transcript_1582/g.4724 Transcript_1582/m.4724 type:complete len:201 (-) Transcript_1582:62-664(-)